MNYKARRTEALTSDEMAVYNSFGFSEKFARLLSIRGIDTKEKIQDFFDFSLNKLHDPFLLKGMKDAVDRINTAAQRKEKILIIGDYDADGISSVAILYKYFLTRHISTRYFLPDRNDDGYGLNIELIDKLAARFQPNLIITVDCGISCHAEVEHAKSLGIDVIVTDHHAIPQQLPECICVNPKFMDQEYPFHELCGAGVALKLVHALGGIEAAEKYLDICAIATVADIVPLLDENRVIVTLGLAKLNENSLPSITALSKSCNIWKKISSSDISFKLGPKINASGRMGNAKRGLDIILEQNATEIEKIISSLNNYNTQRQKLCNTIFDEVDVVIAEAELYKNNIIICASDRWESGVLGIVSARVTEKFGKPSIIFSKTENVFKGSSRSVPEVNIVKTIEGFKDLVLTFGGHSMAAGLSVAVDKFDEFVSKITTHLNEGFSSVDLVTEKFYDFELNTSTATPEFVSELERLEPVGCDNLAPVFMIKVRSLACSPLANHVQHLRMFFPTPSGKAMQFLYFGGSAESEMLAADFEKEIIFEFQKQDDTGELKTIVKTTIPTLGCRLSYAVVLAGYLAGRYSYATKDEKFAKILSELRCEREVFVEAFKLLKANVHKRTAARTTGYTDHVSAIYDTVQNPVLDYYQFIFATAVFSELGIATWRNGRIYFNEGVSTDLFRSEAYNKVRNMTTKVEIKVPVTAN
jgi:single-stranded-DNA-specific exonuclease RecJ